MADPADSVPEQSANAFAGIHEYISSSYGFLTVYRPGGVFLATQNPIPDYTNYDQSIWKDYQSRMPSSGKFMEQCRAAGVSDNCNARVALWNDFVTSVKGMGLDKTTLLQLTNVMTNELINYDYETLKETMKSGVNHNQTPFETLSKGAGICTDIALIKYETLRELGIEDKDLRLITGVPHDKNGQLMQAFGKPVNHMVLMANADGRNYILNNTMVSAGWKLQNGGLEPDTIFLRGREDGGTSAYNPDGQFVPMTATNQDGTSFYLTKDPKTGLFEFHGALPAGPALASTDNQIHAGNSSISLRQMIAANDAEKIKELIQRAHDLNDKNRKAPVFAPGQTPVSPEQHLADTWNKPPPSVPDQPKIPEQPETPPSPRAPDTTSNKTVTPAPQEIPQKSVAPHPVETPHDPIVPPKEDPPHKPPQSVNNPPVDHSDEAVARESQAAHPERWVEPVTSTQKDKPIQTVHRPDVALLPKHSRHTGQKHQFPHNVRHDHHHHRPHHKPHEFTGEGTRPAQPPQAKKTAHDFTIGPMKYHAEMNGVTHQVVLTYTYPDGRSGTAWPTDAHSLGKFVGQGNVDKEKALAIDNALHAGGQVLAGRQQAQHALMTAPTGGSG